MSDILKKVDEMTDLTESQKARLFFKDQVFDDLINFLQVHIQTLTTRNELEDKINSALFDRIDPVISDEDDDNSLTNFELLKLKEILSREKVDSTTALIRAVSESTKNQAPKEDPKPKMNEGEKGKDITQEDINTAVRVSHKLNQLFNSLEKTETSEGEKKD